MRASSGGPGFLTMFRRATPRTSLFLTPSDVARLLSVVLGAWSALTRAW